MQRILCVTTLAGIFLAAAAPASADIKIGSAGPPTNAEALFGTTWQNGMELAIRQANAAGGVNGQQLVLSRDDDRGDPKQGTLIAQKYCDNKYIVAVIANFNSGVTIPSSDVYNRCGMPQVTNSSNPKVTASGYQNLFRPIANDFTQGAAPADIALRPLRREDRRHRPRQASIRPRRRGGVPRYLHQGRWQGLVFLRHHCRRTSTSARLLTTLRQENPDVIYFGGVMPAVGLFLKQAREFGLKGTFFAADSAFTPDFIAGAGPASAGAVVSFQAPPLRLLAGAAEIRRRLQGGVQGRARPLFGLWLHGGLGHHRSDEEGARRRRPARRIVSRDRDRVTSTASWATCPSRQKANCRSRSSSSTR